MIIRELITSSALPALEAEVLMAHVLSCTRAHVVADDKKQLSDQQEKAFREAVARRKKHEPVVYITGTKEFYGRDFFVDSSTLIPRPSTERLVENALQFIRKPVPMIEEVDSGIAVVSAPLRAGPITHVLDIGTGSGVIAITLALEHPLLSCTAVDISAAALTVAQKNAKRLAPHARIRFLESDAAAAIDAMREPFIIVSNPPYIPEGTRLEADVALYEPHTALFAGPDGNAVIRSIVQHAKKSPQCLGFVLECIHPNPMLSSNA